MSKMKQLLLAGMEEDFQTWAKLEEELKESINQGGRDYEAWAYLINQIDINNQALVRARAGDPEIDAEIDRAIKQMSDTKEYLMGLLAKLN